MMPPSTVLQEDRGSLGISEKHWLSMGYSGKPPGLLHENFARREFPGFIGRAGRRGLPLQALALEHLEAIEEPVVQARVS